MRPDYCPMANEPCQAMCEKPCAPIGRLKVAKLEPLTDAEKRELAGNHFAEDWAQKKAFDLMDDFEAAHAAKLAKRGGV